MEEIRKILKKYDCEDIKVRFKKMTVAGLCKSDGKLIYINRGLSRVDIIGTLFHELGHVYCIKNKIYWKYHKKVTSKKEALEKISQAIRAERYVDRWAQRECYAWDKRIKWHPTYFSKEDVKWYKEEWVPKIKKRWKIYGNFHKF